MKSSSIVKGKAKKKGKASQKSKIAKPKTKKSPAKKSLLKPSPKKTPKTKPKKFTKKLSVKEVLKKNPKGLDLGEIIKITGLTEKQVKKEIKNLEISGELEGSKKKISKPNLKTKLPIQKKEGIVEEKSLSKMMNKKSLKKNSSLEKPVKKEKLDVSKIAQEVKKEMISMQRKTALDALGEEPLEEKSATKKSIKNHIYTEVPGFDDLLDVGIPKGNSIIVAGGAGSGKTIFCMQTLINQAKKGKKCLMMTLEEREDRLIQHMEEFGWPAKKLIEKGNLKILRLNPFDITRNVDALLAKQKGELLIDIEPVILPKDFSNPDFITIDSLTAIASAFTGKDESYRIYIEQLFRFLEQTGATSFLITETEQVPKIFSPTGVEEFLADGVIVLYALKHGNVRENAIELLKLRGAPHQKKIVAMQITGEGIVVYPEQEVFSDVE